MPWIDLEEDLAEEFAGLQTVDIKGLIVRRVDYSKTESRPKRKAQDAKRYQAKRDERLEASKNYYQANRQTILAKQKARYHDRTRNLPQLPKDSPASKARCGNRED